MMWKLKRSRDYFGNGDIDLTSGTFWTMPSHCTLLTFIIFSIKQNELVGVSGGGSMIECLNLYKWQTVHGYFFSWCWLIQWHFVSKKIYMYVLHNMNEGYLHCGILHWELLRHKTVSFSKVLDSFWVLVCSQHCVFSASLWLCKYEDIKVSCK